MAHGQHAGLIASSDSRLAEQALMANNITDRDIYSAWMALTTHDDVDKEQFLRGREEVQRIRRTMVHMVRPQAKERVAGFRSAQDATTDESDVR